MIELDLENPWILGGILIAVWIVISVGTEALLLEGDIFSAAIQGVFGGVAFAVVFLYLRRRQGRK